MMKARKIINKPPARIAFNWKIADPCGPDTGKVQETDLLICPTAKEASYQGPLTIGKPIASIIFEFLLAFSIALLNHLE